MKKFLSGLCATALAASFAVSSVVPVNAAPISIPRAQSAQSGIIQAQGDGRFESEGIRKFRRGGDNWRNGSSRYRRNGDFNSSRRAYRNERGWYNGHRGYRNHRRGYRRHGDFWYPAAAFLAGALITGAIVNNNNNRVYSGGNSHVSWCYDRWQSYRAYDNTYQPYDGPRRECYSPYG